MATTNDQAVINLGRLKTYDGLLKADVAKDVSNLQKQVDSVKAIATSAIKTYMRGGVPSADNYPAKDWTTDELKNQHLGDVYYDHDTGSAYRYMSDDSGYSWVAIPDSIATTAAAKADAALNAVNAADAKANAALSMAGEANSNANTALNTAKTKLSNVRITVPSDGLGIDASNSSQQEGDLLVNVINVGLKKKPNGGIAADAQGAYVDTDVIATKASVDAKQDNLTAGEGLRLDGSKISAHVKQGNYNGVTLRLDSTNGISISVQSASTTHIGTVKLSDATDSTSSTEAATPYAVKKAYDLAAGKQSALTFATDDDINAMFA